MLDPGQSPSAWQPGDRETFFPLTLPRPQRGDPWNESAEQREARPELSRSRGHENARHRALEHWEEVWGFAYTLTGNRTRADDLSQEAYARFLGIRRPVDTERSLRPLLFTIVRNLVRSEARRPGLDSLDLALEHENTPASPAPDPVQQAVVKEERDVVRKALSRLSPFWRATLYLRDGVGLSYREIAAVLDRTEDTIRVTLHRARSRIREGLASRLGERKRP